MLTKIDLDNLRNIFATKIELERVEKKMDDFLDKLVLFKDQILHEVVAMRDELTVVLGHRDMLEDHEIRISKLEKKTSKPN